MEYEKIIELLDDMHLSSQQLFLDYYYAMQSNNVTNANNILMNNEMLSNQIINSDNINKLLNGVNEIEKQPKTDVDYYLDNLFNQFQTMIANTKIMGQFNETTKYYPHNFVFYQGKGYYALSEPPIGTLPTDTKYWLEYDIKGFKGYGGININLKYNWDNSINYKVGDIVIYKNRLWYALADNINDIPNLNHYPWVIISMPQKPNRTPIQKAMPQGGYSIGDFWFQITKGSEVITATWDIKAQELTPRFSSGEFTVEDKVYVAGGISSDFSLSNTNEVFDVLTGTWSQAADMLSPRARFGYFTINNIGYVVGGMLNDGMITDTVESYNSTTNTWSKKANIPIKILGEAVSDGTKGYLFGGVNERDEIISDSYIYDPTTDMWSATTNKPTATRGHGLIYVNGLIYAIGGINSEEKTLGNVEVFDIATSSFSTRKEMTTPRSYLGLFEKSGKIYAVGGLDSNWYSVDINEKFNIDDNKWETDMPMSYPRSSLVTATSGNVALAIGGIDIGVSTVGGYVEQYGITDIDSNFDMTIDTKLGGTLNFGIVTKENTSNNFYVDWGDNTTSELVSAADYTIQHTYTQDGEYIVKIIGNTTGFTFAELGKENLKSVDKCLLKFSIIDNMFNGCKNLVSIPAGIFNMSPDIESANGLFKGCKSLKSIPMGLFDQNINIKYFRETFSDSGINIIPNGIFNRNNLALDFSLCFQNTSITTIPRNLFDYNISANTFSSAFQNCKNLTTVPTNLFANNSYCENFDYLFSGCSSLTTIPNIFQNTVGAKTFEGAFSDVLLETLPIGLFKDSINVTNYNEVFMRNTRLTEIPDYTFNGQEATIDSLPPNISHIGDYSLNGLHIPVGYFSNNKKITTVGDNIFSNNVTNWSSMFSNATSLHSIGLQNMSKVSNLDRAFENNTELANLSGFYYTDEQGHKIPTLAIDLDLSTCPNLTYESLINVSNSLVQMTSDTIRNLSLGVENLNKLSDIEKFIIINKYWNLKGWNLPLITTSIAEEIVQAVKGGSWSRTLSNYETSLYIEVDLIDVETTVVKNRYLVDKLTGIVYLVGEEPIQEYKIITETNGIDPVTSYVSKGLNNDPDGKVLKDNLLSLTVKRDTIYIYNTSNLITLDGVFSGLSNLKTIEIEDVSNVTSFNETFTGCSNLSNIKINPRVATNMRRMFFECSSLETLDMTDWDTSSVTDFSEMFSHNDIHERYKFGVINGEFDFSSATNVENMISSRTLINPDLDNPMRFGKSGTLGLAYPNTKNYLQGDFRIQSQDINRFDLQVILNMFAPIEKDVSKVIDDTYILAGSIVGDNEQRLLVMEKVYNNNWGSTSFKNFINPDPISPRPDEMIYEARIQLANVLGDFSIAESIKSSGEDNNWIRFSYTPPNANTKFYWVDATIGFCQDDKWVAN